ncbi:ThiJ/PfpI domain protein OS=Tsukamurella paurometabola (strain ATCC 8368 / DSM / CCUG 35730/ CIP 100753 / JCM 10117 / KCTC 9821 / NBRC 16120 / NCIMB 702349/ NCTC 13040) OX=521096 GN=Tpau_2503 PE=4 SV=1 [Tsukamurella paurometabola]|uniref:ThiJ/PfpI domain protein n=1 Tax=Tsukamurella paurometabola (strain ATCC 8368 / DSM 20162 / CCUG 35730 / CIP 100753 / JCM 10117 / KCTC 9821 / NBRC 16120 / NCIMB 702349 / NCTC 13040) TaxID=521096 RepID=D5URQ2_TSUPD|nr:DJ-1/PfpI family protein [Tsukamurella paurometabola]ADG79107.1 ThiJ/PfpI domain protein [Tsukamurella paurometabola DSM 20162]SUP34102.1 transcriptional activator FtrA [Tsukamurella paurometabola]
MQVAIVVYPDFTALDFIGPYEVLRMVPGNEVRFVWKETGPITADSGVLLVGATHTFDETTSPDIVLVPGGPGSSAAALDDDMLTWLRKVSPGATWTTSVCTGSLVLAAAGLLAGKRATTHWTMLPALRTYDVTPVSDQRIVHEGDIATAAGVSAGIDLALWLVGQTDGAAKAEAVQLMIEYDPQPPFDSGHTSKASPATKARAVALLGADVLKPAPLKAAARLLWNRAIAAVR